MGSWREVEAGSGLRVGDGDEERGHGEVEFVGQVAGQEGAQQLGAPFDHETQYTSFGQIGQDEIEGQRVAGVDEYGGVLPVTYVRPGPAEGGGGAVHQAERARGEEASPRVQVAGGGEGDPGRMGGQAAGDAAGGRRGSLISSRGLSLRIVCAPTMIASQPARTSSTRSRSAGPDRIRRCGLASSR